MKRSTMKNACLVVVVMALMAGLLSAVLTGEAKSKKAFYCCKLYPYSSPAYAGGSTRGYTTKITQSGQKVTIKGNFYKSSSQKAFYNGKFSMIKNKTFTMTKKCKYRVNNGLGTKTVSKKKFFSSLDAVWTPESVVTFTTNASGAVTGMDYCYTYMAEY